MGEKLGSDGLRSVLEKPEHSGKSVCLLYRIDQRRVIAYIVTRRWRLLHTDKQGERAYGIQLDHRDRFIYSNRSNLQGINKQGKKFTAEHCAYTANSWIWFPGVGFVILLCQELYGVLDKAMPMSSGHIHAVLPLRGASSAPCRLLKLSDRPHQGIPLGGRWW